MNRNQADPFLQGYIDAALFTTDPSPPSGCDYVDSGRADELWPAVPEWFLVEARAACLEFCAVNAALLEQAGDPWRNGSDFWYTRSGHGVGFWDRGYPDAVGDALSEASRKFGEHYLSPEDFGLVTQD